MEIIGNTCFGCNSLLPTDIKSLDVLDYVQLSFRCDTCGMYYKVNVHSSIYYGGEQINSVRMMVLPKVEENNDNDST